MGVEYAAYLALGIIWGSNFLFMKWAAVYITPGQIVLLRVAAGFLPILILGLASGAVRKKDFKHWPHFLVMSVLATSFYYYCFAKGTALLPSGIAGMASGAIPFCALAVTLFFLKTEKVTVRKLWGMAMGFLGVAFMARPWDSHGGDPWGVAWILMGCLSLGASFVYARKFLTPKGIPPLALSVYQIGLALVALVLITPYQGLGQISLSPKALWGCLIGLGLLGTGLAYVLYYYIVAKLGAVTASSVSYLPPVVAFFMGWCFMDEAVHTMDFLALACIFAGVLCLREVPVTSHRVGGTSRDVV